MRSVLRGRAGLLAALGAAAAVLAACSAPADPAPAATSAPSASAEPVVTVGGGTTTELTLLQQLYVQLLQHGGYDARTAPPADRATQVRDVASGAVSVVPDYTADLGTFLASASASASPSTPAPALAVPVVPTAGGDLPATLVAVRSLAHAAGLEVLTPAKADHVNVFAVASSVAKAEKVTDLSGLAALGRPVIVAADPSCAAAPTCQSALTQDYGLTVSEFVPVDVPAPQTTASSGASMSPDPSRTSPSAGIPAAGAAGGGSSSATGPATTPVPLSQGAAIRQLLSAKLADVGVFVSTDEVVSESGLTLLADDRHSQPANNVVPVATPSLAAQPRFAKALDSLAPVLTTADLAQMVGQVDGQHLPPAQVARSYLKDKNLT